MLIDWTKEEQMRYSTEKGVIYPNVVTLSQIYSMMCQRFTEDGVTTDGIEEDILDEDTIDPTIETAVERASVRLSGNHPKLPLSRKELLASFAETSRDKSKECLKSFYSILLILGKHYSMVVLLFQYSVPWYFYPFPHGRYPFCSD